MKKIIYLILLFVIIAGFSQPQPPTLPGINIKVGTTESPRDLANTLEIIVILTVLALSPSILIMVTSFTRVIVIFAFLTNAMGMKQMLPNQILIALALFLTFFIMYPVFMSAYNNAVLPYLDGKITYRQAYDSAKAPFGKFMLKQIVSHHNESTLITFLNIAKIKKVKSDSDIPMRVLIPSFILSELEIAFKIGILIYIPFLVIDMVTASILLAMGMIMLPPVMISMPFKIILFVLVGGWNLLLSGIVRSF
jgi:flagellar biosynthetic protein FliP